MKVCANQRDICSGKMYITNAVAAYRQHHEWVCQASGIRTMGDIDLSADAFIVGEHLETFVENIEAFKAGCRAIEEELKHEPN